MFLLEGHQNVVVVCNATTSINTVTILLNEKKKKKKVPRFLPRDGIAGLEGM